VSAWQSLALAARLVVRDWRSGELRVLALALLIAAASVTTVGFFADRVRLKLIDQANRLMGADLVVHSDRPLDPRYAAEAQRLGLVVTELLRFPTMALAEGGAQLVELHAVRAGFPLKGEIELAATLAGPARAVRGIPEPGTVWIDQRLPALLPVDGGDRLTLGEREFRVAGVFRREAEASVGFLSQAPRVLMPAADLESTGLVQPASRVGYRLLVVGPPERVADYRRWIEPRLAAGQRVEDVRDARPELRGALERAERFLGLSALVAVILAGVAVALAARRYLQRHLDACAMIRCLGATQSTMLWLYFQQFALLGLVACALGSLAGYAGQALLAGLLGSLLGALPAAGLLPAVQGFATGFVLLLGFALPPLVSLARVPTLRVLRRELGAPGGLGWLSWTLAGLAIGALVAWEARDARLAASMIGGLLVMAALCGAIAWGAIRLLGRIGRAGAGRGYTWRHGIVNVERRALGSVVQTVALGLGLMALLLLALVRGDLLASWKSTLPADAPNRFLVNIQPDQVEPLAAAFRAHGLAAPAPQPMVRGRLVAINDRAVQPSDYPDERTRRMVDREFNLSWAAALQSDNALVAGRWWRASEHGAPLVSVETGIAARVGIELGDRLAFDIAGTRVELVVASLRRVDWDSMRTNFFVIAAPGALDGHPMSWVTSFRLEGPGDEFMNALLQRFPNLLVIDVAAVLDEVQRIMDQVARAVEFLFVFTLAAGLAVLYAALAATRDERMAEGAIIRTLGGTRRQLAAAQLAEFAAIGALAGAVAALAATGLSLVLARFVLDLPFAFNPLVWIAGPAGGMLLAATAGWIGTRSIANTPPLQTLRRV
jgi:putative ABC transport system permease protein